MCALALLLAIPSPISPALESVIPPNSSGNLASEATSRLRHRRQLTLFFPLGMWVHTIPSRSISRSSTAIRYPAIGEVKPGSEYKRHLKMIHGELSLLASRSTASVPDCSQTLALPLMMHQFSIVMFTVLSIFFLSVLAAPLPFDQALDKRDVAVQYGSVCRSLDPSMLRY